MTGLGPATCPRSLSFIHKWPAPLQQLCLTHGVDAVWKKGLGVLGFPPNWASTAKEVFPVVQAFDAVGVVQGKE